MIHPTKLSNPDLALKVKPQHWEGSKHAGPPPPHRIHEWHGMFIDMNGCFFMVSKMEVNITYMDPMEPNIGIVYDIYDIYIIC